MLDFEEIEGSLGNSSLLMDSKGHLICFSIGEIPATIEIKRSGWTGFAYQCTVGGIVLKEATQDIASQQDEQIFSAKIVETTFFENGAEQISWYVVETTRLRDQVTTTVHR